MVNLDFYHLQGVVTLLRAIITTSKTASFIWVSVEALMSHGVNADSGVFPTSLDKQINTEALALDKR